jgi:hypothetical protein
MRKIFIVNLLVIFSYTLHAQQVPIESFKLQSAKRQIKTGTVLTFTGIGVTAAGGLLFASGSGKHDPPVPGKINNDTHTSGWGTIGYGLIIAGPVIVVVGISNLIIGNIRKENAKNDLSLTLVRSGLQTVIFR